MKRQQQTNYKKKSIRKEFSGWGMTSKTLHVDQLKSGGKT